MRGGLWAGLLILLVQFASGDVRVDFGTNVETNGVGDFSRDVYVSMHATGVRPSFDGSQREVDFLFEELDIRFGRSARGGPFSGGLPYTSNPSLAEMQEDGRREVERLSGNTLAVKYATRDIAVSDDPFNFFDTRGKRDLGTFAARYFKYYFSDELGWPTPKYYECMNEPMVKASSFTGSEEVVIADMAKACENICQGVRAAMGNKVLVGGPSGAFARPYYRNFGLFNERTRVWLENQKSCIDFISEHLYDVGGSVLEGNMDLLESYIQKDMGRQLPYLVSEIGAYDSTWFDRATAQSAVPLGGRDFEIMKQCFKTILGLMRTPDKVKMAVSFLVLPQAHTRGANRYPWELIDDHGNMRTFTPLVDYFRLWKDVDGAFAYSYSDSPHIAVQALSNGRTGFLMVMNMRKTRSAPFDIVYPYGLPGVVNVETRILRLNEAPMSARDIAQKLERAGRPVYRTSISTAIPRRVQLAAEEMRVYKFNFRSTVTVSRKVRRSRHYSPTIIQEIVANRPIPFAFDNIPAGKGMAYIRVAHSREFAREMQADVAINGRPLQYDAVFGGDSPRYHRSWFGVVLIPVDLEEIGRSTTVTVTFPDSGGQVSSVVLEVDQCGGGSCCLLGGFEAISGIKRNGRCDPLPTATPTSRPQQELPSVPEVDASNILRNPGFESEGGWRYLQGARRVTRGAHSGNGCMFVPANRGGRVEQTVILETRTFYRLRCFIQVGPGGRIEMIASLGNRQLGVRRFAGTRWGRPVLYFNTPPQSGEILISIVKSGTNSVIADDCSLAEVGQHRGVVPSAVEQNFVMVPDTIQRKGAFTIKVSYGLVERSQLHVQLRVGNRWFGEGLLVRNAGTGVATLDIKITSRGLPTGEYELVYDIRKPNGGFSTVSSVIMTTVTAV